MDIPQHGRDDADPQPGSAGPGREAKGPPAAISHRADDEEAQIVGHIGQRHLDEAQQVDPPVDRMPYPDDGGRDGQRQRKGQDRGIPRWLRRVPAWPGGRFADRNIFIRLPLPLLPLLGRYYVWSLGILCDFKPTWRQTSPNSLTVNLTHASEWRRTSDAVIEVLDCDCLAMARIVQQVCQCEIQRGSS